MFLPFSLILSTKSSSKSMIENCSLISYWLGTFRWNDCLFQTDSWSQCMILLISKYHSCMSDYTVFLCQFCNDTNKDCCFYQSTIHFENHYAYYYQWHIDHLLNIHKWWWLQSTNHNGLNRIERGLFNNDSKQVASNSLEDWIW